MKKLSRSFYNRTSLEVAPDLLGKYLVYDAPPQRMVARIVETEAYMGVTDKGAHSYGGRRTPRTDILFGPPGYAYIYQIYGMYYCLNAVVNAREIPQAVLIRALEPVQGLESMVYNRYGLTNDAATKKQIANLTSGPGKLCRAFNLTKEQNGLDLCGKTLWIAQSPNPQDFRILTSPRINIDYAMEAAQYPWRYYIEGNPYVSRP